VIQGHRIHRIRGNYSEREGSYEHTDSLTSCNSEQHKQTVNKLTKLSELMLAGSGLHQWFPKTHHLNI